MSNRHANASTIIRTFLGRRDHTQSELAAALGMDNASLSRVLNGKQPWKLDQLCDAAEFLDFSPALFFEDPDTVLRNRWHAGATDRRQSLVNA